MFDKKTFKSKTFWGVILLGAWNAAGAAVSIPVEVFNVVNYAIMALTGAAAVDRSTKVLKK